MSSIKPDQTCQVALGTGSGILFTLTELGPPTKFARQGATADRHDVDGFELALDLFLGELTTILSGS